MTDTLAKQSSGFGREAEIELAHQQKALDTPRTREACKRLGLVLEDLHPRTFESFNLAGDRKDLIQLRYDHYDRKRKEKLAQVLAERTKVIAQNMEKGEVPGVQSGQFLCMLESLFEKEAKRLETDLKAQLRQHSSLVSANEDQLRKEDKMMMKSASRTDAIRKIAEKRKSDGATTKENLEKRLAHNATLCLALTEARAQKKEQHVLNEKAEMLRLETWKKEQAQLSSQKSAEWQKKVDRIRGNNQQMREAAKLDGITNLAKLTAQIQAVGDRRAKEQANQQFESEKQHLKFLDVRAQKDRIDRVEGYRKTELKEQLDGNCERIETLLALKEQLLDQRKARTIKAESTKGARGLNLGRDCRPGPGQYEAPKSCMYEMPCMKVAKSKTGHSEFIDQVTRTTAGNPPPGSYEPERLKNGDKVGETGPSACKMGKGQRDSFLDDAIKAKATVPAPGTYEDKSSLDHRATKMMRDKIVPDGLDKFSAKQYPIWARAGTDTPGPTGYSVDDFTRKEVSRKAQKSLPALTRDMLRPPKPQAN